MKMYNKKIFKRKKLIKDQKIKEKEENKTKEIWQKGLKINTKCKIKKEIKQINLELKEKNTKKEDDINIIEAADLALKNKIIPKEQMKIYLEKKKEMFLMQMTIDLKKEEIKKLEDMIIKKENGLIRAENNLKEDIKMFNDFLEKNKKESRDQVSKAEEETKKKVNRIKELKNLQELKLSKLTNNAKLLEKLEILFKYKEFLDKIQPNKYKNNKSDSNTHNIDRKEENNYFSPSNMKKDGFYNINISNGLQKFLKTEHDSITNLFNTQENIIEKFLNLEEKNLFLIKICQNLEKSNDELKIYYKKITTDYDIKINQLIENKNKLIFQIQDVKKNIKKIEQVQSDSVKEIEESINTLESEILAKDNIKKNKRAIDVLLELEKNVILKVNIINKFTADERKLHEKKLNEIKNENKKEMREKDIDLSIFTRN